MSRAADQRHDEDQEMAYVSECRDIAGAAIRTIMRDLLEATGLEPAEVADFVHDEVDRWKDEQNTPRR